VFVTVDLETNTVERLAEYIPAFDPTLYGVRMDETTLAAAQEAYGIYAEKVDHGEHTANGDSTVGHSDYTVAIDPQGNWRVVYAVDVEAEGIAADVRYLLTE
jgi:protein SCO1/2